MKTNFNSLLDQLDNGLSLKSFIFGIIMIIMSSFAMVSNIFALIVINKFKKNPSEKKQEEKQEDKHGASTTTVAAVQNNEGFMGGIVMTEEERFNKKEEKIEPEEITVNVD